MKKLDTRHFHIDPDGPLDLGKRPTQIDPLYDSKSDYHKRLDALKDELAHLQNLQYAHDRYALLAIFQARDAAGKDGAIKHVMSGVNPSGCEVHAFKQPNADELEHDFLWRAVRVLPPRGRIGIFNRSYYEEVLVVRVHPEILAGQKLPEEIGSDPEIWDKRLRSIRDMEHHLHHNGTRVVKFFLHLSREEQRKRFLARIDEPDKNWKFNRADMEERGFWDDYTRAYEACIAATSTAQSPWYVVPADDKRNARLIVSAILVETLRSLTMEYPQATDAHRRELQTLRETLEKQGRR